MDLGLSINRSEDILDEISEDILSEITSVCIMNGLSFQASAIILQAIIDKKSEIKKHFSE